jgi:hypothetical protein
MPDTTLRRAVLASLAALTLLAGGRDAVPATAANLPRLRAELFTDIRAWTVDGEPSWRNGGQGKTRYGGHPDLSARNGLSVEELSALIDVDVTWDLAGFVHLQYADDQDKPVDLIEAFLAWRPAPRAAVSFDLKGGLYFPHISREHTDPAWTSPYTITASAANSWVGEEVRALGLQAGATWRGEVARTRLTAALFGFNDPAGSLLAYRGWAVNDVKVGAFSRLPLPPLPAIGDGGTFIRWQPHWVHPVREIDGRLGWHAGLDWEYGQRLAAGAFFYDNGGDPAAFDHGQYAWDTRFWNLYVQAEPAADLTIIAQYMAGVTLMGRYPDGQHRAVDVSYDTGFLLLSRKAGKWRFSGRGEFFAARDNSFVARDDNNEDGTAWTLAVARDLGPRDRVLVEVLRLDSRRPNRATLGYAVDQVQTQLQASYRKRF